LKILNTQLTKHKPRMTWQVWRKW